MNNTPKYVCQLEELAKQMASLAQKIRDGIVASFETDMPSASLQGLYEIFKIGSMDEIQRFVHSMATAPDIASAHNMATARDRHYYTRAYQGISSEYSRDLIDRGRDPLWWAWVPIPMPDLSVSQFADIFVQTLAYALFLTRYNLADSSELFPKDSFMRFVEDLAEPLAEVDMHAILMNIDVDTFERDQLIYFYEAFLAYYDPKMRELRGVYYTPEPVVSYMVRSVDHLLRCYFGCHDGLANSSARSCMPTDEKVEDRPVFVVDPSCGTGTFLSAIIDHIREGYRRTGNVEGWQTCVGDHLLPHIFGFELLMAPYLIAHINLSMQLAGLDLSEEERDDWAYEFTKDKALNIYLTNTLEEIMKRGEDVLTLNGHQIMVVLGNPPYSGHSSNKGDEIHWLLEIYKEGCPELKKPAQAKWLSDDYVKFIRFAQWQIEQAGSGILAFITNHSYLDNPTFRGMRRSLLASFDDIYVLDLHGNSKKKELAPDGSKDENIFDIQPGVAIGIFVKWRHRSNENNTSTSNIFRPDTLWKQQAESKEQEGDHKGPRTTPPHPRPYYDDDSGPSCHSKGGGGVGSGGDPCGRPPGELPLATVHHMDIWGPRQVHERDIEGKTKLVGGKYAWLAQHDLSNTPWGILKPQEPLYLFTPHNTEQLTEYEAGWKISEIFQLNGNPAPGIITTHDDFAISWTESEAIKKVERLLSTKTEEEARQLFRLCAQDQWQYSRAKEELSGNYWREETVEILYRPFDIRWTIFNRHVAVHRRERVMRHMLAGENIGLTIGRAAQVIGSESWNIIFCTRHITEYNLFRRGGNNLFPLYLYPNLSTNADERSANLASEFISDFAKKLRMAWIPDGRGDRHNTFGPEDIFAYIYAIFYSPAYRKRFASFLKVDFPRLLLTSNSDLFRALCQLGDTLIDLHVMGRTAQAQQAGHPQGMPLLYTNYPVSGDNVVERIRYVEVGQDSKGGKVWINKTQYFDRVPTEAWTFHIGGYQVCQKWLKDRKGRKLSEDELLHYQRVVAILAETSSIMKEIDETIEKYGGWPIQ